MTVVWLSVCMNAHSVVEDWEAAPFDGGFGGLADLGSRGFDGAVEAADTWLFLRDGEPVAVVSDLGSSPRPGDVDAFEGASGRKHEAPNGAVVTLAAMLALDGEVRGRYFTDDTPLSAVHDTLSGGGFTGYVELSENVLSGDYYYVYVDGEVDHVGFVGSSQRLYGEDARTKAESEVGIYAVTAVSLPDLELPDAPEEPDPGSRAEPESVGEPEPEPEPGPDADTDTEPDDESSSASALGPDGESGSDGGGDSDGENENQNESGSESESGTVTTVDPRATGDEGGPATVGDSGVSEEGSKAATEPTAPAAEEAGGTEPDGSDGPDGAESAVDDGVRAPEAEAENETEAPEAEAEAETEAEDEPTPGSESDPYPTANGEARTADRDTGARTSPSSERSGSSADGSDGGEPRESEATRQRESGGASASGVSRLATRSVPSLDPERSGEGGSSGSGTERDRTSAERSRGSGTARRAETANAGTRRSDTGDRASGAAGEALAKYEERIEELEAELEARASEIDEYEDRVGEYEERIEGYEQRVEGYERRIDELQAELEALRSERDELEERLEAVDADASAGTSYSPEAALSETSLFVRERTRGEATLEDGHDGTEDRETVVSNLRIDYHTTFDSADATVENQPFETWLRSSSPYEFAEWLVTELLFEIRSTGAQSGLRPLYDVLPAIDRIGFGEEIPVGSGGESEDPETKEFDIVAHDKKGNPLVVAYFDQRRDPTRADTIGPFVTDSSDVCEANETLAAAVAVTSSYFEADAMNAAEEATSSSFLSRNKYRSYVNLSRSNGYHLCLVEARENTFNLTVPEL
jgi:prefoldin subunit 5